MPGKNKTQKNGFYFYMQDLVPVLKREGRVFPGGMADVVPIAHPRWRALDDKDKERYENMAKEHKRRLRGQMGDAHRMDNVGNIIAARVDPVAEYERAREREIRGLMKEWTQETILKEKFYFIDVQTLCKTDQGQYLPVEMAIAEFSLEDGLIRVYHEFLHPGEIPTGMRFTCQQTSDDEHKIPVEGHPDAQKNFLSVQNMIENFVNYQRKNETYPPVFALRQSWDSVDYTLDYIRVHSCMHAPTRIQVYELESLFIALVEFSGKGNPPSKTLVTEYLTPSIYDYHSGLKCTFHEDEECKYCSQLIVKKFCYSLAEHMESCYDFVLKKGSHIPTAKQPSFQVVKNTDEEGWSAASSRNRSRQSSSYSSPERTFFKTPANIPRSQPTALANQRPQPAPILRPPGAQDLDFRKNKASHYPVPQRFPSPHAGAPFQHQGYENPGSAGAATAAAAYSDERFGAQIEDQTEEEISASRAKNKDLMSGRVATWLPPKSGVSWSRTSTPASTPRATPMATPLATPLVTPRHSPPRAEAIFPPGLINDSRGGGRVGPPPGFSSRPLVGAGGDTLAENFPSLSLHSGRGRGRLTPRHD